MGSREAVAFFEMVFNLDLSWNNIYISPLAFLTPQHWQAAFDELKSRKKFLLIFNWQQQSST